MDVRLTQEQLQLRDSAREFLAAEGIQIHGGLGFTWEHDLHLFYNRAKACEVALGDVAWTRERAARVLIDRTP